MTTEERLEKLEKRLDRASRRNRWLVAGVGLLFGAWVLGWCFEPEPATAQPAKAGAGVKEVRARRLTIEDENSNKRAELGLDKSGMPGLYLYDENGESRAVLLVRKTGPRLNLLDARGMPRLSLFVTKDGPKVYVLDKKGGAGIIMQTSKNGPHLQLGGENSKGSVCMFVDEGGPHLGVIGADGKMIWRARALRAP